MAPQDNGASWGCSLDAWMCGRGRQNLGCDSAGRQHTLCLIDNTYITKHVHHHFNRDQLLVLVRLPACIFPFILSQNLWTTVLSSNHDLFIHLSPCSFSKATLTTTPIRRICLSLRSTPDMSEWSPGSGTSASLYAWSCWAAMTRRTHHLTSNSASSQTTAEEQRIVCYVHRLCLCVKIRADRSGCSAWSSFWLGTFSVSAKNKHC